MKPRHYAGFCLSVFGRSFPLDFSFWALGGIVRTRMVFDDGNVTRSLRRPVSSLGDW